jgi:hypothetical protein
MKNSLQKLVFTILSGLFLVSCFKSTHPDQNAPIFRQDVFVGGQDGYHTYRIPALVKTIIHCWHFVKAGKLAQVMWETSTSF